MDIQNRHKENCTILDLVDERFEYPKTLLLKSHVNRLLEAGETRLILNMERVEMLDSFGIAVIIGLLKACRSQQGNLSLFGLNASVTRLMEVTHMERVLDIWETETQALFQMTKKT